MKITYTNRDGKYALGTESLDCLNEQIPGALTNMLGTSAASLSGWTLGSSAVLAQDSDHVLSVTNGAASTGYAYRAVTTVANTYYLLRAHVEPDGTTSCKIAAGTTAGASGLAVSTASSSSLTHEIIFKASGTTTYVSLYNTTATSGLASYWSKIEVIALEHIGVDETTQLYPTGNAASLTGEADSVGSWVAAGAAITSQSSVADSGTWAIKAESNTTPTSSARVYYDLSAFGFTASDTIELKFRIRHVGTGGIWNSYLSDSTVPASNYVLLSATDTTDVTFVEYTYTFTYSSARRFFTIREANAGNDGGIYLDAISIKKTGNLVANCAFYTEAGATAQWTLGAGADWTISGGVCTHNTGNTNNLSQAGILTVGQRNVVTFSVSGRTAGNVRVFLGGDGAGAYRTTNETFTETLTVTTNTTLYFVPTSDFDGSIDNVSVRLAEVDDSANGDGLEVHGELVKVPVNYGSDTTAFANFTAYNYLKQPYSSSMNPASGDFSWGYWFRRSATAVKEVIAERGYYTSSAYSGAQWQNKLNVTTSYLSALVSDDAYATSDSSTTTVAKDDSTWHHAVTVYDKANLLMYLYVDGALSTTTTVTASLASLANSNAAFFIGCGAALANPFGGKLANITVDIGNAWTANQIKTMYNSEAPLFNEAEDYRVYGGSTEIVADVSNISRGEIDNSRSIESMDYSSSQTLFHGSKDTWSVTSKLVPLTSDTEMTVKQFKRFIDSAKRGTSFTFDERGETYYDYDPRTVRLTSKNHGFSRMSGMDFYRFTLKFQEK